MRPKDTKARVERATVAAHPASRDQPDYASDEVSSAIPAAPRLFAIVMQCHLMLDYYYLSGKSSAELTQ